MLNRIQALRRARGLTQAQLATEMGVTQAAVSEWEQVDGSRPSIDRLRKLAAALGVTVDDLLRDDQPTPAGTQPTTAPTADAKKGAA